MAQNRQKDILRAAREVLAEKGFEATTISEVVARAGVAQGTFYLYFPAKTSLIEALSKEMLEQTLVTVNEAVTQTSTINEAIEAGVRAAFLVAEQYCDVLDIVEMRTGLTHSVAYWEDLYEPYYNMIVELIQQGQETGELDPNVNATLAARMIVGLVEKAADDCFLYRPEINADDYIAEATRFVQRALNNHVR